MIDITHDREQALALLCYSVRLDRYDFNDIQFKGRIFKVNFWKYLHCHMFQARCRHHPQQITFLPGPM
jgi:hypothetical protein